MESKDDKLVTIRIGKNGVTPELLDEVSDILRKYGKVKVKMLKTSMMTEDRKEIADKIRKKTKSRILKSIGNTILLMKKK